ncbi:GGDEF domain-containing protein [Amycolatopsis sp. QT-25]|uniref:GGDEF domain-containing protein n=1 Tax=Amycolatopsis sp. QT-25 TaxID=3034022 RepID=UPI0023ED631C|nr:GGDEF domain-containing protein [Amycolatopsis sp. QT-25]WET82319.1 GGDEF domain-containing protein [Amycolatopsis sp. QT-25]
MEVTLVSEFAEYDRDPVPERPRGSLRGCADTVGLAAARVWRLRGRASNTLRHPAGWELWRLPPAAVFWMLGTEVAVAVWALYSGFKDSVTTTDLVRFGVIAGCTIWYLVQTQHPEEQRRADDRRGEHIDQTAVWLGSAAVLLPPTLSLLLLLMVRVQRYSIAHKAMTTFLFTTAAHAVSILGVRTITELTSPHAWLESGTLPQRTEDIAMAAVSLVCAALWYFASQTLLISIARGLAWGGWRRQKLIGSWADNADFVYALQLAACTTILGAVNIALVPLVMIGVALRSTRLSQALADTIARSQRDRKTGLLTEDSFHAPAALRLLEDQTERRPTAFLMLDLDHFKQWNDKYGHSGGDIVLGCVSAVLRQSTRATDLVGRWGGEEFAVLLPDTTREEAMRIAERIREAVAKTAITGLTELASGHATNEPRAVGPILGCTVSIGVGLSPEHSTDYGELFRAADSAMYQAKRNGRNRVVLAPSVLPPAPRAPTSPLSRAGDSRGD